MVKSSDWAILRTMKNLIFVIICFMLIVSGVSAVEDDETSIELELLNYSSIPWGASLNDALEYMDYYSDPGFSEDKNIAMFYWTHNYKVYDNYFDMWLENTYTKNIDFFFRNDKLLFVTNYYVYEYGLSGLEGRSEKYIYFLQFYRNNYSFDNEGGTYLSYETFNDEYITLQNYETTDSNDETVNIFSVNLIDPDEDVEEVWDYIDSLFEER